MVLGTITQKVTFLSLLLESHNLREWETVTCSLTNFTSCCLLSYLSTDIICYHQGAQGEVHQFPLPLNLAIITLQICWEACDQCKVIQ